MKFFKINPNIICVSLFFSLGANLFLYKKSLLSERALNRPFVESYFFNSFDFQSQVIEKTGLSDAKKAMFINALLLDFLNSGFFQPLDKEYKEVMIIALKKSCSNKELSILLDRLIANIDHIQKENGVFSSRGEVKFTVMGGAKFVRNDYEGTECLKIIELIKGEFLQYLK